MMRDWVAEYRQMEADCREHPERWGEGGEMYGWGEIFDGDMPKDQRISKHSRRAEYGLAKWGVEEGVIFDTLTPDIHIKPGPPYNTASCQVMVMARRFDA